MSVKLFVLGRPGSGKTTAFRHFSKVLARQGWSAKRFRDYDILHAMFLNDREMDTKRFRPIAYGGFDVLDFTVLDEALAILEKNVTQYMCSDSVPEHEVIVLEFARSDYATALSHFSANFRAGTHVLFTDAHLETCIERIQQRVRGSGDGDRHNVSEKIIREYYGQDCRPYMQQQAALNRATRRDRLAVANIVSFVDNNGPLPDLYTEIDDFTCVVIEHERKRNTGLASMSC